MAKDPAVLFYTSDFLTGTALMNNAQKGAYITLLCLQHQQGHLSIDDILDVCGGKEDRKVMSKFKRDEDGCYYNERMDVEGKKRKKFIESRTQNLKSKSVENSHMEHHMESRMENENINRDINKYRDSKYIENNTTTTTTLNKACARTRENVVEFSPPSKAEVFKYFEGNYPQFDPSFIGYVGHSALDEAEKFYAFNSLHNWENARDWEKAADLWVARIKDFQKN